MIHRGLYADGEAYGTAVTLTADTLSYEWKDLPKFADGEEIEYTVDETGVPDGYEKTVDGSKITNKYTPETTTFTVTKVWDDNSDQDGKRDDYTVQLYADGESLQ